MKYYEVLNVNNNERLRVVFPSAMICVGAKRKFNLSKVAII